ncbi:hypothetical protein JB92DRAFT_1068218 [Gautieria morchelliformis]|nr:hypothetical protein JB92DRAFT_1068218 [Gautieria morchelliformis]
MLPIPSIQIYLPSCCYFMFSSGVRSGWNSSHYIAWSAHNASDPLHPYLPHYRTVVILCSVRVSGAAGMVVIT